MSYETELKIIEQAFAAGWAASPHAGIYVQFENVEPVQPNNDTPWVRLTIRSGDQEPASLGKSPDTRFRSIGIVILQIFTPLDEGVVLSKQISDTFASIFRNRTIIEQGQEVRFRSPSIPGNVKGDDWLQTNVTIPFQRDTHF